MPESIGPAIARDRLSARLRELREASGLSLAEVAGQLTWPESAIGDLESGWSSLPRPRLEALLELYGVADPEASDLLLLARLARSRFWWARQGMTDEHQNFVEYESEADRICVYQPLVVPGLMQTPDYARATTATVLRLPVDDPRVTARADLRMERQRLVADRIAAGERVRIVAVLDEVVLRRGIGGDDVMRDQLDHLAAQARLEHVTLVIMPTAQGGHAGLGGVFEMLELADEPELSTVFIESTTSDHILRGPQVTETYRGIVDDLVATGSGGDEAVALLREIRDETGR